VIALLLRRFLPDPHAADARPRAGLLSGTVGIFLNLLLCCGKFAAGILSGSIAITGDAFNNLTDAGSSVVTLVGFRMAAKAADEDHPFGHGRIEYLTGLIVSVVILLVGVELGKSSLEKIFSPTPIDFSWAAVGILVASILVKLWLYRFNHVLGRRIGSAAMAATATDSLSDAAATAVVLAGTLVGSFSGLHVDGWLGLAVTLFILKAGWGAAKDTIDPLLGQPPDPAEVAAIKKAVLAHDTIRGIHDLVIHDYGPGRRMLSFHAEVPRDANMLEVHDEIDNIERELKARFRMETVIHMDPIATDDPETVALQRQVTALMEELDPKITIHDFRVTPGPLHTNLIFDVVVPHSLPLSDEELKRAIDEKIAALEGQYYAVVSFDRVYTPLD